MTTTITPPTAPSTPSPSGRASPPPPPRSGQAPTPPRAGEATMFRKLIATSDDRVATLLRVVLGLVMFPHGAQKVFGWFGGGGLEGTMGFMTGVVGVPAALAALAIAAEFLGSLGLIAGLFTRVAGFGILSVMVVAALTVHWSNGFFMNWTGAQAGEGFEFHILAAVIALAVMVKGGGALSLDRKLQRA